MTTNRTTEDKVADWLTAYRAIQYELTPQGFRALTAMAAPVEGAAFDPALVHLGIDVSRIVFANDRTASITAAMLTQSGISRPIVET
jgi:hypothetical protein